MGVPDDRKETLQTRIAVMGKSWGARMAAEAGALPQVVATVLVVPGFSDKEAARTLPDIKNRVALCMVEDDPVVPFKKSATFRKLLGGRETWIQAKEGGHKVVPEFVQPIANFIIGTREKFTPLQ